MASYVWRPGKDHFAIYAPLFAISLISTAGDGLVLCSPTKGFYESRLLKRNSWTVILIELGVSGRTVSLEMKMWDQEDRESSSTIQDCQPFPLISMQLYMTSNDRPGRLQDETFLEHFRTLKLRGATPTTNISRRYEFQPGLA